MVTTSDYVVGLDVGPPGEFTALAVVGRTYQVGASHYAVRHLERFAPGTAYESVAARLAAAFGAPGLGGSLLAVDQTAVGRPVVELLRSADIDAEIRPLTVTAGHQAGADDRGDWLVPKKELVSLLQLLLQSRRLRVALALPESDLLTRELAAFRLKPVVPDDPLSGWRDGQHDDLVLAVAIACWAAERIGPPCYDLPIAGRRRGESLAALGWAWR